jgi:50S ribosomal protein L16 3-hydroxylase
LIDPVNDAALDASRLERLLERPIRRLAAENFPGDDVLFLHGDPRRYAFLDTPALASIEALANAFAGTDCLRVLPNRLAQEGYGDGAAIDAKDAPMFLDMGMSVWVRDLKSLPLFRDLERRWAEEAGIAPDRLYCQLFVSPRGARTLRHFDVSQNLVLQLKGTKRWTVAPYDTSANGYPTIESELIPDDTVLPGQRAVDARPGDLMCLPFCWWHSTEALAESWSLTVFLRAPTWKTLVEQLILARIEQQNGAWAHPVIGLDGDPATRQRLAGELARLLADIPRVLQSLSPDAVDGLVDTLVRDRDVGQIGGWRRY